MGPTLQIDTSAAFNMNFNQHFHPMSATTAPSPSDFGTPGFFTSGPQQDNIPASNMGTPFNPQFMSPMPHDAHALHAQAPSPMHSMGPSDPIIANQSPPLNSLGRSASADMYQMHHDSAILDDGGMFLDMKQSMTLPFRNPMQDEQHQAELDMNSMVNFNTVDPSSLAPNPM
jgi:hypothetical protein